MWSYPYLTFLGSSVNKITSVHVPRTQVEYIVNRDALICKLANILIANLSSFITTNTDADNDRVQFIID